MRDLSKIDWYAEVLKRKDDLLRDLQELIQIKSVYDETTVGTNAPFGEGPKQALHFMLQKGVENGFKVKNVDHYAGHIEMGAGEELIGVLGHVDVVPEGDGWTFDPYGGEMHDGKIYGRGTADDKGPTIAAFYGMKIVKELGLPLAKRVRLIIGTDEESGMRCVQHYFQKEEMPDVGFVPDADFPIIYAEKGIASFDLLYDNHVNGENTAKYKVIQFEAGRRYNMVPDFAQAIVEFGDEPDELTERFQTFLCKHGLNGEMNVSMNTITLTVRGVSAHAMEPDRGVNAGLYLALFLADENVDSKAKGYFTFIKEKLFQDSRGHKLNVAYQDEESGELTVNAAIFSYESEGSGKVGLNFRYPVTYNMQNGARNMEDVVQSWGFTVKALSDSKPLFVDKNEELIKVLQKVYEEQTGEKATLLSIGGGTYARHLKKGVAFGAMFPGREDVMHQKDEYMYIEDLLKATSIYAQAIYELAK